MSQGEIGVGSVLGDTYEVTSLIGQGGMGAVWAAKHKRLPKRFAVKVLLGALQDSEGYARFRREAETTSRIGHPNIVEVLDFNTLPSGTPYLVMEFLEGESLAARIKRGPISLQETLGLARQIGSALHAAHKNEVVHRDLKPDNIFLCPSDSGGVIGDRVKVLDFGISKIKNLGGTQLTQESTLMGTPQYMSPEQASGKNSLVDQRTDVFALGAIIYEMLSGKPAFWGETLATVVVKVMLEQPPPLEELQPLLPASVRGAVLRALEKDVQKRFPDVGAFIGELTGSPLQTLDRRPVVMPEVNAGFASTEAGTPVPPTNRPDAFAATAAGVPTPAPAQKAAPVQPALPSVSQASLARGEVAIATMPMARKRSGALVGAILAGVVIVGGGGAALMLKSRPPDPKIEAKQRFEVGLHAFEAGDYATALREFTEADVIAPDAEHVFNIGMANDKLGQRRVALNYYKRYLAEAPSAANRGQVEARVASLELELQPPKPATELVVANAEPPPHEPAAVAMPVAAVKPAAAVAVKPADVHAGAKHDAPLPADVAAELQQAEQALSSGDAKEAVRLARHSLIVKPSGRAFSLIARGMCKEGDLGGARAALHSVEKADTARVKRDCKAAGIDL